MLGALLRVLEQALGGQAVLLLVGAARVGAGDRPGLDAIPRHLDQGLGRGAGDLEVAEVEEVHVGRGIDRAQAPVDREGLDRAGRGEALRRDHLEGVAGVDVLDDPRDGRLELLPAHVGLKVDRGPSSAVGLDRRDRLAEPLAHLADRLHGAGVGLLDPAVLDEGVGDQRHLVALVVEGDQYVGDHQGHVRAARPGRGSARAAARRCGRGRSRRSRPRRPRTAAARRAPRSRSGPGIRQRPRTGPALR